MYLEREVNTKFQKIKDSYNCIALVGPRQCGKTTFLKEHIKQLKSSYIVFDDPDAITLFEEDIKKFENQYINDYDLTVLDEIQYCKDAGKKLKYLVDKGRNIWITSSSEIILGKEVLSYLVGRVSIINQFSISEFLEFKKQKELTKIIIERMVWEHITYGGYPKVVITEDIETKKIILKDLYETMIFKDVSKTFSINDIKSLEEFVKYLSLNIGNIIQYETISKSMNISFQTVKKYLDALEKSYLILKVTPFFTNKIKELVKQPKFYFIDTGLRNVIAKNFNLELEGKTFENYIASELIKLGFYPKYWRNKLKAEVDFVLEIGSEIIPIEIKLNADTSKIERSLKSFIEVYKPKKAIIISYKSDKKEIIFNGCRIIFTNLIDAINILSKH